MLELDYYTYYEVDGETWIVEYKGAEFCVCSYFEEEKESPEKRAKSICDTLNYQLKAKFIVADLSEDYGKGSFGVSLNDLSDNDTNQINVWEELGDAVEEKNELIMRDVAGVWEVFALIEVEPEITLKDITEEL